MNIEVIPMKKKYEVLLDLYPPKIANKFLPEWYKKQKLVSMEDNAHNYWKGGDLRGAKACPAIQDLVTAGIIIPLWSNLHFTTEDNGNQIWEFPAASAVDESIDVHISKHPPKQIEDLELEKTNVGEILKLTLPYWFKVPEGYNLMYVDPFYHFRKDIRCLSGIVEADKWGTISVPFEILKPNFTIKAGTPLLQAIPIKREEDKINLVSRAATDEEYYDIKKARTKTELTRQSYKHFD